MFLLIGGRSAFVEQYSYGKLSSDTSEEEVILGSDMPLIEYRREIDEVYTSLLREIRREDETQEQLRPQPYPLLVDHFDYAWEQATPLQNDVGLADLQKSNIAAASKI